MRCHFYCVPFTTSYETRKQMNWTWCDDKCFLKFMLEIWDAIGYQYNIIAGEPLRTIYEDLQVNDFLTLNFLLSRIIYINLNFFLCLWYLITIQFELILIEFYVGCINNLWMVTWMRWAKRVARVRKCPSVDDTKMGGITKERCAFWWKG